MKYNIPFSPPDISEREIELVVEALRSGWITTGPKTKLFETEIAKICQTERAVTMNSATACMEMTLRLLGVGPGDEVITSAYTYTASASVIHHVGAKIVLVDTAEDSFEMDYSKLADAITENTKVIIPVDLGGVPCDYSTILDVVESKKGLYKPTPGTLQEKFDRVIILSDAAHSFGSKYKGQPVGSVADFTSFSFHAVKNLTTAEGGAVVWKSIEGIDDADLYQQYMHLILHGQTKDALSKNKIGAWEYDIVAPYYKFNLSDVASAIGLAQLERYDEIINRREEIVKRYINGLTSDKLSFLNHFNGNTDSVYHLFLMRIKGLDESTRNAFIEKLAERGIATNVHYKPLPLLTAYKNLGFKIEDYPNAYKMYENEITLPLNSLITDEEVDYVVESVLANL